MTTMAQWWQVAAVVIVLAALGFGLGYWLVRRKREVQSAVGAAVAWLDGHPELKSQFLEIGEDRIHYIQAGKGPHLVLLHGIGASLFTWRLIVQALSMRFTVTALDLPGFGRSSKRLNGNYGLDAQRRQVIRFLDELGIHRAFLSGSSMGGAIALWMAHENPERFPKVAALGPATSPILVPRTVSRLLANTPFAHKTVNRQTMKWILEYVVAGRRGQVKPETIEAYLEPFLDEGVSVKTFLGALDLLADRRMPDCYRGMQSDVLIIAGQKDKLVTASAISRLKKVLDRAQVITHPAAGHHMMEDEPDWTAEELTRFFLGS